MSKKHGVVIFMLLRYCGSNTRIRSEVTMLIKRFVSTALCFICIFVLVACGKKADPIVLPRADDITSIDISSDGSTVSDSDKIWICEMMSDISAAEPTGKESVQDIPQTKSYIKVVLTTATDASITLYVYEDADGFYIEQPYQGIYKTDSKVYERLHIRK